MVSEGVKTPGVRVTKRPAKRVRKQGGTPRIVKKEWTVAEIVERYPQATEVMAEYGLHCFGCSANALETLEEGCLGHGFTEDDIRDLVSDINEVIRTTPPRPQELRLTKAAALAIKDVAEREKIPGPTVAPDGALVGRHGLSVQAGPDGGFFMEFRPALELGEKIFQHPSVPEVSVYASILTLQRIGGATIDFREGKFKLDVGEGCCGEAEGGCGCRSEGKEVRK